MERAGTSLGMDRSCGAASAKRRKEDNCRWTVPVARLHRHRGGRNGRNGRTEMAGQTGERGCRCSQEEDGSVEGPRRWRVRTDRIQMEEGPGRPQIFSGAAGGADFSGAAGGADFSGAAGGADFSGAAGGADFSGAVGGAATIFSADSIWCSCV